MFNCIALWRFLVDWRSDLCMFFHPAAAWSRQGSCSARLWMCPYRCSRTPHCSLHRFLKLQHTGWMHVDDLSLCEKCYLFLNVRSEILSKQKLDSHSALKTPGWQIGESILIKLLPPSILNYCLNCSEPLRPCQYNIYIVLITVLIMYKCWWQQTDEALMHAFYYAQLYIWMQSTSTQRLRTSRSTITTCIIYNTGHDSHGSCVGHALG